MAATGTLGAAMGVELACVLLRQWLGRARPSHALNDRVPFGAIRLPGGLRIGAGAPLGFRALLRKMHRARGRAGFNPILSLSSARASVVRASMFSSGHLFESNTERLSVFESLPSPSSPPFFFFSFFYIHSILSTNWPTGWPQLGTLVGVQRLDRITVNHSIHSTNWILWKHPIYLFSDI